MLGPLGSAVSCAATQLPLFHSLSTPALIFAAATLQLSAEKVEGGGGKSSRRWDKRRGEMFLAFLLSHLDVLETVTLGNHEERRAFSWLLSLEQLSGEYPLLWSPVLARTESCCQSSTLAS